MTHPPDPGVFSDLTKLGFSVDLGDHDTNGYQWPKVNLAAGTKVMISVLDDKEEEGWSGIVSSETRLSTGIFTYALPFRLPSSRVTTSPA